MKITELEQQLRPFFEAKISEGIIISYRFLHEGCDEEAERDTIRHINKAQGHSGDTLIGNWLLLTVKEGFELRTSMDALMEHALKTGTATLRKQLEKDLAANRRRLLELDVASLKRRETALPKLVVCLVNAEKNAGALQDSIYRQYGDVAAVVYAEFSRDENSVCRARVTKRLAGCWEMDEGAVYETALKNTAEKYPAAVFRDVRKLAEQNASGELLTHASFRSGYFVLTSDCLINGAALLFCPGTAEKLSRLAGGRYYAVMTSADEVHIHSVKESSYPSLLDGLLHSNDSFPDTVLTEMIFCYDERVKQAVPCYGG